MTRQLLKTMCLFAGGAALLATGCGKARHASPPQDAGVANKFDVRLRDTELIFPDPGLMKPLTPQKGSFAVSTDDWMRMGTDLAAAGSGTSDPQQQKLEKQGASLIQEFYKIPDSTFPITMQDNPYVPSAYRYVHDDIIVQYSGTSLENRDKVLDYVKKNPLKLTHSENPDPAGHLQEITAYLQKLPNRLSEAGVISNVTEKIRESINSQHIQLLKDLNDILDGTSVNTPTQQVLKALRSVIAKLPESMMTSQEKSNMRATISLNERFVRDLDGIKSNETSVMRDDTDKILLVLVELYKMPGVPREKFPKELRDLFGKLSPEDLDTLNHHSAAGILFRGKPELAVIKAGIYYKLSRMGVFTIKRLILQSICIGALDLFDKKLETVAAGIPSLISTEVTQSINTKVKDFPNRVDQDFETQAESALKEEVFGDSKALPVLEKARVIVSSAASPVIDSSFRATTTTVLAEALKAQFVDVEYQGKHASDLQHDFSITSAFFRIVSKLLIIGGYDDVHGNWSDSLHVNAGGSQQQKNLNIKAYEPAQALFATPDLIYIKDNWRLDDVSRPGATFSAYSQMALLSAYADSIRYFRKWQPNIFDKSIGLLAYPKDSPFAKQVFPKVSFYKMSMGLGAIILKNMAEKNIVVLDMKGGIHKAGQEDLVHLEGRQSAVLVDFNKQGVASSVKARDVGMALVGLSEAMQAISDFEKTDDPQLISKIPDVQKARPLLEKLLVGMANFATTKLLRPDGGFAQSYDFESRLASAEPRTLEDQILLIRGLLHASKFLDAPLFRFVALDAFFFLKAQFYSSHLGFFREREDADTDVVRLKNVASFLTLVQDLRPAMVDKAESLAQLNQMESFVVRRFFPDEKKDSPRSSLLVPFSP